MTDERSGVSERMVVTGVNESAVMCLDSQLHQFSHDSLVFFDLVFKSRLSALIYAALGRLGAFT